MIPIFWSTPPQTIKNFNRHAVIDLIRFTPGGISRVELAEQLQLTRAAITTIINDLQASGLVREVGHSSPPSSRRIVLEICPQRGKVVGVDIGATHVTFLLADYSAAILDEQTIPLDIRKAPQVCLEKVDSTLKKLLERNALTLEQIDSLGVGIPGPVSADEGLLNQPPLMPEWDSFPVRSWLENRWNRPVSFHNDAELGALGEWAYGAGRGEHNLAYIKAGTGIGSGLMVDGQIYSGTSGSAGEIGHITIQEDGPLCSCGNTGCLEALAGGRALLDKAARQMEDGKETLLGGITAGHELTMLDLVLAARQGDEMVTRLFSEAGTHIGTAVASLVNLFNPGMIIIGGGLSRAGELLLEPLRMTVRKRSLQASSRSLRITTAVLGHRASGMGAVIQALSAVLHPDVNCV